MVDALTNTTRTDTCRRLLGHLLVTLYYVSKFRPLLRDRGLRHTDPLRAQGGRKLEVYMSALPSRYGARTWRDEKRLTASIAGSLPPPSSPGAYSGAVDILC